MDGRCALYVVRSSIYDARQYNNTREGASTEGWSAMDPGPRSYTALVIAADPYLNEAITKTFHLLGNYTALSAFDGAPGLLRCSKDHPALVVLYFGMPQPEL